MVIFGLIAGVNIVKQHCEIEIQYRFHGAFAFRKLLKPC